MKVCAEFREKKVLREFFVERGTPVRSLLPRGRLHPRAEWRPRPDQPLLRTRSKTFPSVKPARRILRKTWEAGILPLVLGNRERPLSQLGNALYLDGRAVGEHFGDALHHFRGVIAHSDDGVGSVFAGVL